MNIVKKFITQEFNKINERENKKKKQFYANCEHYYKNVLGIDIFKNEVNNIFKEDFKIRNHMIQCSIVPVNFPSKFIYSLHELSNIKKLRFFCPWIIRSMNLFKQDSPCTALFSRTGELILTGGYNLDQVINSLSYYCYKIILLMYKKTGLQFTIKNICIRNILCTNKLLLQSIDTINFFDFAIQKKLCVALDPNRINLITYKLFPDFKQSITCNIFPKGGINVMGFTSNYELKVVSKILSIILKPYIRNQPNFDNKDHYINKRKKEELETIKKAKKRKLKKLQNWKKNQIEGLKKHKYTNFFFIEHQRDDYKLTKENLKILKEKNNANEESISNPISANNINSNNIENAGYKTEYRDQCDEEDYDW